MQHSLSGDLIINLVLLPQKGDIMKVVIKIGLILMLFSINLQLLSARLPRYRIKGYCYRQKRRKKPKKQRIIRLIRARNRVKARRIMRWRFRKTCRKLYIYKTRYISRGRYKVYGKCTRRYPLKRRKIHFTIFVNARNKNRARYAAKKRLRKFKKCRITYITSIRRIR